VFHSLVFRTSLLILPLVLMPCSLGCGGSGEGVVTEEASEQELQELEDLMAEEAAMVQEE